MSGMRKRKGHTGRKILFGFEILILVILVGVLYIYMQINKHMDKLDFQGFKDLGGQQMEVQMNENVAGSEVLSGYTNIALFGLDKRGSDGAEYGNSDTLIIASINNTTKEIRLVSLYRDTYLRVGEDNSGNGIYSKCNSAYLRGGPSQAISMLNTNLDLDIQNFIAVDFSAMTAVVDSLGGLDVELSYAEIVHMNNHCVETSKQTGKDYEPIEEPKRPADIEKKLGTYHLNGVQVTSFCRIRQTTSMDMGRTERQRYVLGLLTKKAKAAGLGTLTKVMDEVFPMILTNFSKSELIKLGTGIFSYNLGESEGFPKDYIMGAELTTPVTGLDCLIPTTLETNVKYLHNFLFSDEEYQPSGTVMERSKFVAEKTGFGNEHVPKERRHLITDGEDKSNETDLSGETDLSDGTDSSDKTGF